MVRLLGFFVASLFVVPLALAQEAPTQPSVGDKPLPEAAPLTPKTPKPDTTLLNDTHTRGLKARIIIEKSPKSRPLPVGKRCVVELLHGQHHQGILESHDEDWLVLRREDENMRTWIATRHVAAVMSLEADDEQQADASTPARTPDHDASAKLQALVKKLQAELAETRAKLESQLEAARARLAEAQDEAEAARRDAASQRDLLKRVRQRAEAARRAAEQELQRLWDQLKQATEAAPE